MAQAGEGEGTAEAAALLLRVDTDHVDLADRPVVVVSAAAAVDLGPVEPDQPVAAPGNEEALRVEPGLGHPLTQIVQGQRTCSGC